MTTNSSISITIAGSGEGYVSAEVDDREGGFNADRTALHPGDEVYFFVFTAGGARIGTPQSSAGSIRTFSPGVIEYEEVLTFAKSREATLARPAAQLLGGEWYGNNLGGPTLMADQLTVRLAAEGVGAGKIRYTTQPQGFVLTIPDAAAILPPKDGYPIVIVVEQL